eukprot:TRINITY_DN37819_c0_g1_i1.p1 TRINITY_DN37819_c0_g1~~TRINITY_DN37819_c0_g1_i1.p1  ORF type:complete len:131 (-),score=28.56 TRINITY_DN37819_c0_g1_i1:160-552(-)
MTFSTFTFLETSIQQSCHFQKLPRLEKFCCCLEVHTGVTYFSIGLGILWILYAIAALVNSTIGNGIWALIISIFDIIALVYLWIFSALVILIIAGITTYYALGLKTVYDDLGTGAPPPAEPADNKTVNPV